MKTRSIASILLLVSQVESSRVTKHESSTWSLSRVERVLSKHNVIPSKKNLVGLKQRGDELDKLKAKFKLLISVLLIVFTLRTNIFSAPTITTTTTTTTTEDKSKEKGARVQKLSFIYKMALVDAHLVMGVSERALSLRNTTRA